MRTSYEDEMMKPRRLIKAVFIFIIIVNLVVPMYHPYSFFSGKFYFILLSGCYVYGFLGAMGYNRSTMPPMIPLVIIRLAQFTLGFIMSSSINIISFILCTFIDLIFCFALIFFHSSYEYIEVDEFEED